MAFKPFCQIAFWSRTHYGNFLVWDSTGYQQLLIPGKHIHTRGPLHDPSRNWFGIFPTIPTSQAVFSGASRQSAWEEVVRNCPGL